MNPFSYSRPTAVDAALKARSARGAMYIGGGTNLLDLAKSGIERPSAIVDVTGLDLARIETLADGGLRIGALARNTDIAAHEAVRTAYPLLAQAILSGASQQLRNMATAGGNLLQRTRCYYFVDPAFSACNKKAPGSGCAALSGEQRLHAIFGASDQCIATNPSDMNVALAALGARIRLQGPRGERSVDIADFHRLPGQTPQIDSDLQESELVTSIDLPPGRFEKYSHYLKLRDRTSYAFALVSVAAALDCRDGRIVEARIALGGVAHKPWRVAAVENALVGCRIADAPALRAAAVIAVADARVLPGNAFKRDLVPRAIVRAVETAGAAA